MPVITPTRIRPRPAITASEVCATFIAAAQLMLDPATPESARREA